MTEAHYVERCEHGTVGGQCRCPSKDKQVRIIPCPHYCPKRPNAAPKASEAPVEGYQPGRTKMGNLQPAPAPEPDPLKGIDAQKWAKEFMRIWAGRWSEVDEGLMIGWFANAIMRGFDEGQRRLRKQHGCELPPLAEPKPSAPPAPEPKQGSACCEECKRYHRHFRTDCCKCRISFGPSDIPEAEPKQGSEEPIEPVTELEAEKSTSKILRNLLVKAEAERDEARATKDMHKERQEEAWAAVAALCAEVEKLKRLDIRPSTGSDLLWVEGKHRCAATISNNHLWQVEDEAEALRAENERLQGIIMGTSAEYRVTLGVNLRRYWSAENQVMLGRMLFDEDVPALRAELAAAREEISKLREMRAPTTPTVEMVRLRQSNQEGGSR